MPTQRIRDPLHDLIEFNASGDEFENILWQVLQTRPFQRLRRVKQLGFSDLVYPGATHSRFAHSVGVFHTARRLMDVIRRHLPRPEESKVQQALAAALVHDLGHGPFSHAFENVGRRLGLRMADHEHVSDILILQSEVGDRLRQLGSGFADDVADIIKGRGKSNIYRAVVSSQFDADRLDYMRRDRLMTGTQHASVDFEWLLANLEVGRVPYGADQEALGNVETFVLGPKAIHAAEGFVLGLFQLYPTVYFHKTTRGAEALYTELLTRIVILAHDGAWPLTGIPENHPLIKIALAPEAIESALGLDDSVVWGALPLLADSRDQLVAEFACRLRDRKLYKCIDVRAELGHVISDDEHGAGDMEKACAAIREKLSEWVKRSSDQVPRILIDEAARSPYKRLEESEGPLDQINIRTPANVLIDLGKRSPIVAAIKTFRLFRVYVADGDTEARDVVRSVIEGEMRA